MLIPKKLQPYLSWRRSNNKPRLLSTSVSATPRPQWTWNDHGQVLAEASLALPIVVSATAGILVMLYLSLATTLIDRWSYDAALCLAKSRPVWSCQKQLEKQLSHFVFHKKLELTLIQRETDVEVRLTTSVVKKIKQSFDKHLELPLLGRSL